MSTTGRTGVVLAGGYSTRFGDRDKALAEVGGDPMLARVVSRLGAAVGSVVVNCRSDQQAAFERLLADGDDLPPVRFVLDPEPDGGPLVGIKTAFEGVESEYTAVVACDMPGVDPNFLSYLFERAEGTDGAVPKLEEGHLQPVQAVYRTAAMRSAAKRQLADDDRSLRGALDHLDVTVVSADEVSEQTAWRSLRDVNRRSELDAFEGG